MGFWAAVPGIASAVDGLFGKKNKGGQTIDLEGMLPSWQRKSSQDLSDWSSKYMNNFIPGEGYSLPFSSPLTGYEEMGLNLLGNYMDSPDTGELFGAGKQQILDTLGGRFADPSASPFIKSMSKLYNQNLNDLLTRSRAGAGARGTFFSQGAIQDENRLRERTLNNLNSVIGNFIEGERGRMFQAAPMAQEMDKYSQLARLQKIMASQSLGNLERTVSNADLEKQYQDWIRQRQENQIPLEVMQGLSKGTGMPSQLTMPVTQETNSLGQIMNLLKTLNLKSIGQKGSTPWDIFSMS